MQIESNDLEKEFDSKHLIADAYEQIKYLCIQRRQREYKIY